jgi:GNAT superfamily N-acetyltransferase
VTGAANGAGAAEAGAVLGRAFSDDPLMGWLLRGGGREQRLVAMFSTFAATADRTPGARVLVDDSRTAAAIWLPPGSWRQGVREFVRTAPPLVAALRGGTLRGIRLQTVVERHHLREPHWYLEALGVVPELRGRGLAQAVVQPVLDLCDDARLPAYLESSNPRNYSFYERLGFVRGTPLPVPAGCPTLLPMTRRPR